MARRLLPLALCLVLPQWLWLAPQRRLRTPRRAEEESDWREFRARLVQQEGEKLGISQQKTEKWAYESPIIEQGAILLSAPNDHFCINQQYFHKNVIFLVSHNPSDARDGFTKGVILNRPTAFSTGDLESSLLNFSKQGADDWNVWCGGDCQGINDRVISNSLPEYSVLHGLESLKEVSETITKGVYAISLEDAKAKVAAGEADRDDFLLLVGYCGWGDGQLQDELDRGDTWTMASIDPALLLGQLREEQAELRERLWRAEQDEIFTADDVGDGLDMWERLYRALGPKYEQAIDDFKAGGENEHSDEMLRRWINRCLIPPRHSPDTSDPQEVVEQALKSAGGSNQVAEGTVLRGSAIAWLLGKPFEDENFQMRRFLPSQYLHKAVLLVIKNERDKDNQAPSLLAMLNGPQIGRGEDQLPVYWGGPQGSNYLYKVLEASETSFQGSFQGFTMLRPGMLEALLEVKALEVSDCNISQVLSADLDERWQAAGGKLETLKDLKDAQLGDRQRRKWFKRMMGLDLPEPED